ncbi:ABC transporter permease subunit [Ramlibacter sp. USB13]|uniref:ABC transporter permease subunit n=1 Tax=Ramlibacter cellulosilyticus TaxID=2764187 RepID=A0A923MS37_9BURK|nr:glycine betaine ABC transporter substrate-binding protein [Ramlibacter cellulosilyticus]MBC5784802.1 ABC transporter permease subunit [Ramlibacter cellulosilyticus]
MGFARRLTLLFLLLAAGTLAAQPVVVGSKRFTESYILGEIVRQVLADAGTPAVHRQGLGNTAVMEQALATGSIALYPEYTGTIVRELLKRDEPAPTLAQINAWLAPRGLKAAVPLGFNNGYALAMREDDAARLGIATISDLARSQAPLRFGLSHEFLVRADGWPALQKAYAIPFTPGSGLDHGLAYQALAAKQVDVVDAYTTDAQIARLKLRVLRDDRDFFPRYDAVLLMRAGVDDRPLAALAGRIDEDAMRAMNGAVEIDGKPFAEVARAFLAHGQAAAPEQPAAGTPAPRAGFLQRLFAPDLPRLLREHLVLVFASLAMAVALAIPLGVLAWQRPRLAGGLMGVVGVAQTVPSLALLAFLIALVGRIGFLPALLALTVYALLPVVRNTHAGLASVPAGLRQSALALGLREGQVLRSIELPLALPTILAGIKTAAVWNVGMATVATFIGAGGLGERIVAGLAVNDTAMMLAGAVPAALLALAVQWLFDGLERWLLRARTPPA